MYIPLYNKTTYTLLSSLLEVDDLINLAISNNLKSIAITDDNMFGVMEFILKCKKNNLNPIVGLDLKDRILYAKNYIGYQKLLKIESIKSERNLTEEDYNLYKSNLICIPLEEIETNYEDIFYPLNESSFHLENVIYINKLLYKEEDDYKILKYLELLRDSKTILDPYEDKKDCYYKEVRVIKKALDNTIILSNLCNLELPKQNLNLAIYDKDIDSDNYLTNLSLKGLNKRLNDNVSNKYKERLKHELDIIKKMGFSNYFLVVYDFIKYAKSKNILVGPGRGSAASSLVSYTLGITDIDPLKYDLLFERFLNPERITMPDIDTDFPDIYRDDIIHYVINKYGKKNVSNIITFNTMGPKLCIRDIGRVMNVSLTDIDKITKVIGSRKDSLKEIVKDPKIKELMTDIKIKELLRVCIKIEGIKRNTSIHAAGIIIANNSLDNYVPLIYDQSIDSYISGYEASYLEDLGLLKMDFLGIKNLTTIMDIINDVFKNENIKIKFSDIPLDDIDTYKLFQNGDTNGIFQFESIGMKNFLKELKPDNFKDLANAIALYRPGPAQSIPLFIKRKNNEENIDYFDNSLVSILKDTYGIIIYQEQIMKIANIVANYSLGEADILRRAMSKKKIDIMKEEKDKFISRTISNGYQEDFAIKIFSLIEKFASYGFNKSHSIAYTIIAYKMAYLKVHYKKYFYVNLLNSVISDVNKTEEYLYEMKKYDLKVLKPDIRYSTNNYILKDDNIIAPFNIIKGISNIISSKIIEERNNFKDIYDIFRKLDLTKNNYELLIKSGCFDDYYNRKTLLNNLDSLLNYSSLSRDLDSNLVLKPDIIEEDEYSKEELINMEKELFGFYLSNHPTVFYKAKEKNIINLKDIEKYFNQDKIMIVLVEQTHEIKTKKGDKMLFFKGSDEERVIDFTVFPKVYEEYFDIRKNYILKVFGKIEKRNGEFQIIVSKIERLV